jgi:hypothetical protein
MMIAWATQMILSTLRGRYGSILLFTKKYTSAKRVTQKVNPNLTFLAHIYPAIVLIGMLGLEVCCCCATREDANPHFQFVVHFR